MHSTTYLEEQNPVEMPSERGSIHSGANGQYGQCIFNKRISQGGRTKSPLPHHGTTREHQSRMALLLKLVFATNNSGPRSMC